ncbi:MAG: T9SS type A sorting domain-containing protein [Rhodothermales bacterium]|nr:T9SS type A sorting domain-containing protein [Rhodothermales bacterium]
MDVRGQQFDRQELELSSEPAARVAQAERIDRLHVTDQLLASPAGREALARYRQRRDEGLPPEAGKGAGASVGSVESFSVWIPETDNYQNVDFTLAVAEDRFNIWVETALLASNPGGIISDDDAEKMRKALADSTGPNSYRPDLGIIALDELIFGSPPDVDGDGRTDVLIHDIQDGYDPGSGQFGAILGYFDPSDLNAPNSADIIHIDAMPGMYSIDGVRRPFTLVQQTLAHEYEHLLFQQEGGQAPAFVDEGLAEWAEVLNGYVGRAITYNEVQNELRRPLFGFRSFSSGSVGFDYQRAGLFTNYFAERVGIPETGSITGVSSSVEQGYYQAILGGDDPAGELLELIHNFHVANAINDRSVAPEYGHAREQYGSERASGFPLFHGDDSDGTSGTVTVEPGGVAYVAVDEASDFTAFIDAASGLPADRARIRGTVIAQRADGTTTLLDLAPQGEGVDLGQDYARLTLLLMNEAIGTTASVEIMYDASWAPVQQVAEFQEVAYDDGTVTTYETGDGGVGLEGFGFFYDPGGVQGTDDRAANRFAIPAGAVLASVDVALLYRSHFVGENPTSQVRDFRIGVWSSTPDGFPDQEIVSFNVSDGSSGFNNDQSGYVFLRVDLTPYRAQLSALEGELHVTVENAGTDDNYIFVPHTNYGGESNPSFIQTTFGEGGTEWASYENINSNGNFLWANLVNTIRAVFELNVIVNVDDDPTLPQTVTLEQNYPNPFNPATTIRFSLPESRPVHLRVFDMLGRHIATLADGVLPAGQHEVAFEAGSLSSGLYLYRLDAGGTSQTRTMMLVK